MHGIIHHCFKEFVIRRHGGQEAWIAFIKYLGLEGKEDCFKMFSSYPDSLLYTAVEGASKMLVPDVHETSFALQFWSVVEDLPTDTPVDQLLEDYGEFFYHYVKFQGLDKMLHRLGRDFQSFLASLDFYHNFFLATFVYGNLRTPRFRCEQTDKADEILFRYYSYRPALWPIAQGLAREVAKEAFKLNVSVEMINQSEISDEEAERTGGPKYFTEFRIKILSSTNSNLPLKLPKARQLKPLMSNGHGRAVNEEKLPDFTYQDFRQINPYHIIFDHDLDIIALGAILEQRISSGAESRRLVDHFIILYPSIANINWDCIVDYGSTVFVLETIPSLARSNTSKVQIKGQMLQIRKGTRILFMASPRVTKLADLQEYDLFLSDIPLHDTTRELVLVNEHRQAEVDLGKRLEATTESLQVTSRELVDEKKKLDGLLYELLPRSVADNLKIGKEVQACEYPSVTILFTDIVTFTQISAKCHARDVVSMLNMLFTRFDTVCNRNDVFKVETIGDAYMIASGVPTPSEHHAESMADTALDLLLQCAKVFSPVTGNCLQIRVGMHSGPVMAGVVGKKRPRYCLFGDSVNTASRMESHGVPGKIQMSSATRKLLKNDRFLLEKRGEIDIKGKGAMMTFFLKGHKSEKRSHLVADDDEESWSH